MSVDQYLTEQPSAAAASLATYRGLGDWTQTFATRQGWAWRKWRDWRLYLYTGGVVVTAPTGLQAAYDWNTARIMQYLTNVTGGSSDAKYMLIDPDGTALEIGMGVFPLQRKHKEAVGITEVVHGAPFPYPRHWGSRIQGDIAAAQLPGVLARLERGETVNFGPYEAGRHGLTGEVRKQRVTTAWSDIHQLKVHDGTLFFNPGSGFGLRADPNRKGPDEAKVYQIPNFELFLHLCHTVCALRE